VGILIFIASNGKEGPFLAWNLIKPSKKTDNPYQQELEKLVKAKLDQPLFNTSLRLLVIGSDSKRLYQKGRGFVSALSSFSNSGYQAIVTTFNFRLKLIKKLKQYLFTKRLLKPFGNLILSSSEISDLYHFPFYSNYQKPKI